MLVKKFAVLGLIAFEHGLASETILYPETVTPKAQSNYPIFELSTKTFFQS